MYNSTLPSPFALPAEWEPQSAIMLTWPHANTDWKPYLAAITSTYIQLAKIITHYEQLLVATPNKTATWHILHDSLTPEQMEKVHLYEVDSNDTWARDHGPLTMVLRKKQNTWMVPIRLLDFKFNGWGEKFKWQKDNTINLQLYYQAAFNADLENHQGFVLEGGSIESDGKGTLFTTSQCLLAPHRNQPFTRENIDHQLKNFFNLRQVVWLDHGNLIGDDTDGHIDTIVRVAPHDTLLYIGCDDPEDEQYEDFKALEKQLQGILSYEGYPYRLLKLPMPDPIYDNGEQLITKAKNGMLKDAFTGEPYEEKKIGKEIGCEKDCQNGCSKKCKTISLGDRLPATYANFLILNGAVIYPTYNQPEKDELAKKQIQLAFPDREIIGVDSLTIIRQHGSIHCLTMQLPQGTIKGDTFEYPASPIWQP